MSKRKEHEIILNSATSKKQKKLHAQWWQKGPIYHIYPKSFQDSNADGVGDLKGKYTV